MRAFVEHQFTKGFILDEERIRKLNEILIKRGEEFSPDASPTYEVIRADSIKYETKDVQEIVNEANAEYKKITELRVVMGEQKDFELNLDFNDDGKTDLTISGSDRDKVFLLFSDLREYIENEVCTIRLWIENIGSNSFSLIMSLIYIIMPIFFILIVTRRYDISPAIVESVLKSNNVSEKVNYLIERDYRMFRIISEGQLSLWLIGLFVIFCVLFLLAINRRPFIRMFRRFFPSHLFMFGKEIEREKKRQQQRTNFFWGVIIAAVVSLVTGIVLRLF